jgi:replicative DNA helicase
MGTFSTELEDAAYKVPPQNIEAEQSVLGAILIENTAIYKAIEIIGIDDFYKEAHKKIYLSMIELSEKNEAIDLVTLTEYLRKRNELDSIGGATYLSLLANTVPTAANIKYHSKIIYEKALLRNLINTATEIVSYGYENSRDIEELLDYAENAIFRISEKKIRPSFSAIKDIIKDSFETIERLSEKKERITGIPTGFYDLDMLTSGFQPSDLIIVAGRPSMGKTALCLCIAQHAGIEKGQPVAIFSLEMAKEQLVIRMLCAEARVDSHKLRSGFLAKSDWPRLTTAAGRLSEAPIFIDDSPGTSVLEMKAKARRLKAEHGLSLIVVDYLQLMSGRGERRRGGPDTREQEISEISRSLKALAKELSVPVIALSQLNRAVESRQDKRPLLSDLRESGAIEQDADVILFIYREEVYKQTEENKGVAEIIIGKQRNGPVGIVKMAFIDKYTRFENLEKMHGNPDS